LHTIFQQTEAPQSTKFRDKIPAMQTIGVIADTHIPDRVRHVPPKALDIFRKAQVTTILHAGDISVKSALNSLEQIAPVIAVRGNRDLFYFSKLPLKHTLTIEQVTIGLTHGHGSWPRYIRDRIQHAVFGQKKFSYYEAIACRMFPTAKVVILGHNHAPANYWLNDQLVFNPGSPTRTNPAVPDLKPSIGLLHIDGHNVEGEIVFL
jgi:putative phosphoesterase